MRLGEIVESYGSDKKRSGYTQYYEDLFSKIRLSVTSVLEIGIGTLDPSVPSTFAGNKNHYPDYKPGGSLRAWRDYFENAQVYGIDVAEDCNITEDRIQTFIFSSLNKEVADYALSGLSFDIIVDDGLHTTEAQLTTLQNFFHRVRTGGYYVVEDCANKTTLFEDFEEQFLKVVGGHEWWCGGNTLIIRKNKSGVGRITGFLEFTRSTIDKDITLVSGLWDIGREGRGFEEHYIPRLQEILDVPLPLVLFLPESLHDIVWEKRTRENTHLVKYELEDIKRLYSPHWDKTQQIRSNKDWLNIAGEGGWLTDSPQAKYEWYNPIVQSKMFLLHDASVWNPFNTDCFYWIDAGLTSTVPTGHLTDSNCLSKLADHTDPFLFLSYPYESAGEIHGFDYKEMNKIAGETVKYVCRGGLFGGKKEQISIANGVYYSLLTDTLGRGLMGTEESVFTLMSYLYPNDYRRYELDENGLIVKFTEALINDNVELVPVKTKGVKIVTDRDVQKVKTNLYILTFNFPEQLSFLLEYFEKTPEWLNNTHKVLIDNSTKEEAKEKNKELADKYGFEYHWFDNIGINGGRQFAAEHFDKSDADFMFFFEDDMTLNTVEQEGEFCRNGFRKYIPDLYSKIHKVIIREGYDFVKLSFTEVFMDNNIQCSWYNVPQEIRTKYWPEYDKLPTTGLDPSAPKTKFNNIKTYDGLSYIDGEIYYCNWPTIVSKEGNRKMFIETKFEHVHEQTLMSFMFQETKKGNIKPAVLLASPITHDRQYHYSPDERREC